MNPPSLRVRRRTEIRGTRATRHHHHSPRLLRRHLHRSPSTNLARKGNPIRRPTKRKEGHLRRVGQGKKSKSESQLKRADSTTPRLRVNASAGALTWRPRSRGKWQRKWRGYVPQNHSWERQARDPFKWSSRLRSIWCMLSISHQCNYLRHKWKQPTDPQPAISKTTSQLMQSKFWKISSSGEEMTIPSSTATKPACGKNGHRQSSLRYYRH